MFWKAFLYGGVMHLVLLRAIAYWGYRPPANRSVINHPVTNIAFAVLGGVFVGWLGARLARRVHADSASRISRFAFLGAGYGVAATELTIEASCLLAALALACHAARVWGPGRFSGLFLLSFIDIQTYAMGLLIQTVPFGFVYGLAGGLWLARVRRTG